MSDKDGGPAFPQSETALGNTVHAEHGEGGMTLRDYFAAAAIGTQPSSLLATVETKAAWAYAQADAMLKERAK